MERLRRDHDSGRIAVPVVELGRRIDLLRRHVREHPGAACGSDQLQQVRRVPVGYFGGNVREHDLSMPSTDGSTPMRHSAPARRAPAVVSFPTRSAALHRRRFQSHGECDRCVRRGSMQRGRGQTLIRAIRVTMREERAPAGKFRSRNYLRSRTSSAASVWRS